MTREDPESAKERGDQEWVEDVAQGRVRKDPGGQWVNVDRRQRETQEEALDRPASEADETEREETSERPHWDVAWRQP